MAPTAHNCMQTEWNPQGWYWWLDFHSFAWAERLSWSLILPLTRNTMCTQKTEQDDFCITSDTFLTCVIAILPLIKRAETGCRSLREPEDAGKKEETSPKPRTHYRNHSRPFVFVSLFLKSLSRRFSFFLLFPILTWTFCRELLLYPYSNVPFNLSSFSSFSLDYLNYPKTKYS